MDEYFVWLCSLVDVDRRDLLDPRGYSFLLRTLHDREFYAVIDRDNYRAFDGESLRKDYFEETGRRADVGDDCTILEMLVALSRRIEFEIMYDYRYGERVPEWFWMMVRNLGLSKYDNMHWNERAVSRVLTRFLDREYGADGVGGLFPERGNANGVSGGQNGGSVGIKDQREVEIWWQMQRYFAEKY